jgi:hypothetical protein
VPLLDHTIKEGPGHRSKFSAETIDGLLAGLQIRLFKESMGCLSFSLIPQNDDIAVLSSYPALILKIALAYPQLDFKRIVSDHLVKLYARNRLIVSLNGLCLTLTLL